ncbi:T6SS effector phospholipase Tle3 domain-containing protein [Paraburkholderia adhaesiva]|uniref:T6SS effector phospholipase Tle3 domain-containing protein n=1 Tax=Paraburkholderia adhaesiva TaxID=2883244 RepID=UPI001F2423B4|nr:DUF3274 domain-containing protein [Paraburkholderia adhaesiva]
MTDTKTTSNTLRNSKQGQEAMPMPAGSGAMLTCKVPVKRPMPCTVIVIHGVNDDGQCFPIVDEWICKGLNHRLGRDDLYPHEWGPWKKGSESTLPQLDAATQSSTVICKEGRSPVIPFHWGYRPVDELTYRQEQQRYLNQLKTGNRNPELPYNAYCLATNTSTGQNGDNLGNWLNGAHAKDGGPFPNATTNLVDMWGPGPSGGAYGMGELAQRDPAARLHDNPHRIYYVHAARRLADLIIRIRKHPTAGSDTINIIAHSQGTEISMLANFMVAAEGDRPVDCLIMCDSPYGLYPTEAELAMPGKHQSSDARRKTLVNFTTLMRAQTRPVAADSIISKGVASSTTWSQSENSRSNFGSVYNYFCPQDSVVALPNIQGIGWQGVDDEALSSLGPNFYQRVFSEGHVVGAGPEKFLLGGVSKTRLAVGDAFGLPGMIVSRMGGTPVAGVPGLKPTGEGRTINGAKLPQTYTFHILKNGAGTGDKLGEHLAGTALADGGVQPVARMVDASTGVERVSPVDLNSEMYGRQLYSLDAAKQQLTSAGYPYVNLVRSAWSSASHPNQIVVWRSETNDEALKRLGQQSADWSQHSAITLSTDTIEKCMTYDLAIGLSVAFDDEILWWDLIHQADWRSNKSPDKDAQKYFTYGILPGLVKEQMNKPNLPKGIVNDFAGPGVFKFVKAVTPAGLQDNLIDWIKTPSGGTGQWPLPIPDVRG